MTHFYICRNGTFGTLYASAGFDARTGTCCTKWVDNAATAYVYDSKEQAEQAIAAYGFAFRTFVREM